MALQKLKEFLDDNDVKYVLIRHSPAYTAQEVAASGHVPGKELAKSVIVKLDGDLAMVALTASEMVSLESLKDVSGAREAEIATESDFEDAFPGCELGAMPPFGNLFGMDVYVSETLAEDEEIAFSAGTHTELLKMPYRDFERLVQPRRLPSQPREA